MTKLKNYTLEDFGELLSSETDIQHHGLMTRNFVVIRDFSPSVLMQQFAHEPITLSEMRVLLLKKGRVTLLVNLIRYTVEAGDLIYIAPDSILQIEQMSDDVMGEGFSVNNDIFAMAVGNNIPQAFDGRVRDFKLHMVAKELKLFDDIHLLLYTHARETNGAAQITLSLLSALFWHVSAVWANREAPLLMKQTREQRLFKDFLCLVRDNVRRERNISFYADKLCITPRYMSSIIAQVSGYGAKKWIDDALIANIKIELKHTDKSIGAISDDFSFPNVSFFCKYFKRMTGVSPGEYR